ncbi:MAG: cyclic nucleotide-binding domain-containing protein, partial [Pseudomonadota bacterium]
MITSHDDMNTDRSTSVPDILRPLPIEKGSIREFKAGEAIAGPRGLDDRVRFIMSGEAVVALGYGGSNEAVFARLAPGDVYGDLDFLTGRLWPAKAELAAATDATVLEIPTSGFQRVLREDPEFAVSLLATLSARMVRFDRGEISPTVQERALESVRRFSDEGTVPHLLIIGE